MILKIRIPINIIINTYVDNKTKIIPKNKTTNDKYSIYTFEFDNFNSFVVEALTSSKKTFNLQLFRDNWYNGIKSTLISADVTIVRQQWEFFVKDKFKSYLEINISSSVRTNVLNGYDKYFVITTQRTNLSEIICNDITHFVKIKTILFFIMLVNIIPLVLTLSAFIYTDIYHPDYFRSGPLYIIIADIPIAIVLIIYLVRYFIYLKNFKHMIDNT